MLVRSHDLTDRISDTRQSEIFTLPIDAARCKAREIIDQIPQSGFIPVIENWRQRPDGQIEFAIRHLPAGD
jgi:phosphoribosylformylglycinamidine (FGAM) synthase PurS component